MPRFDSSSNTCPSAGHDTTRFGEKERSQIRWGLTKDDRLKPFVHATVPEDRLLILKRVIRPSAGGRVVRISQHAAFCHAGARGSRRASSFLRTILAELLLAPVSMHPPPIHPPSPPVPPWRVNAFILSVIQTLSDTWPGQQRLPPLNRIRCSSKKKKKEKFQSNRCRASRGSRMSSTVLPSTARPPTFLALTGPIRLMKSPFSYLSDRIASAGPRPCIGKYLADRRAAPAMSDACPVPGVRLPT